MKIKFSILLILMLSLSLESNAGGVKTGDLVICKTSFRSQKEDYKSQAFTTIDQMSTLSLDKEVLCDLNAGCGDILLTNPEFKGAVKLTVFDGIHDINNPIRTLYVNLAHVELPDTENGSYKSILASSQVEIPLPTQRETAIELNSNKLGLWSTRVSCRVQ